MGIGIVIALLAAGIAGFFTWRAARRRKGNPGGKVSAPDIQNRSLRMVALGHEGSGKTILLASLWRELAIGRVRVVADTPCDEVDLRALCRNIDDPQRDRFPESTALGEEREWNFTVQACNPDGTNVDVFKFSYYDYPGELLDEMARGEEPSGDFAYAWRTADIVVGIIDGQMVSHLMGRGADPGFGARLDYLCLALSRREVKALHLIITKWDLLAGRYTLAQVEERLKEFNTPFRRLLGTPRSGGVRIIPVSSLGSNGFAFEDSATQQMRKSLKVKDWTPEHVVAPLACTIPDVVATDIETLRRRTDRPRHMVAPKDVSGIFIWAMVALGFATPIGHASAVATSIHHLILKKSLGQLKKSFFQLVEHARRHRNDATELNDTTGLLRVLGYLQEEVDRLQRDFPEAKLTIPGTD
jgi:hypothetical protein